MPPASIATTTAIVTRRERSGALAARFGDLGRGLPGAFAVVRFCDFVLGPFGLAGARFAVGREVVCFAAGRFAGFGFPAVLRGADDRVR